MPKKKQKPIRKRKTVKGNPKCKTKRKQAIQHSSKKRKTLWRQLTSDSHLIQVNFEPYFPPQQRGPLFGSEL